MAQVIIEDIDEALVSWIDAQARREQTSSGLKLRDLVERAIARERSFWEVSQRSLEQTRGAGLDATALIREDRDR